MLSLGAVQTTSSGSILSSTLTWDYLNRLTQDATTGTTSTYGYDMSNERIKEAITTGTSTVTTYYPTKFYNITAGIPTKHIFANGVVIATITGSGSTSTVSSILTDHLTGSNVVTNASGTITELSDYYPFGATRRDDQTGSNEQRKFAGHEYDAQTGLSYMDARYYNPSYGRFLSEDPSFLGLGAQKFDQKLLANPQAMNAYSYVSNNPLKQRDPDGKCIEDFCVGEAAAAFMLFGPQINFYVQSLLTPLGQYALDQARQDVQKGYYGWAAIGAVTAGDIPAGEMEQVLRAGDKVAGLGVTEHAAAQFAEREMKVEQIEKALNDGVKYMDEKTGNIVHVIGERGKQGFSIVTDVAQKTLVTVENFVQKLDPKRFKKL